jgi:hypothetical protein
MASRGVTLVGSLAVLALGGVGAAIFGSPWLFLTAVAVLFIVGLFETGRRRYQEVEGDRDKWRKEWLDLVIADNERMLRGLVRDQLLNGAKAGVELFLRIRDTPQEKGEAGWVADIDRWCGDMRSLLTKNFEAEVAVFDYPAVLESSGDWQDRMLVFLGVRITRLHEISVRAASR